MAGLRIAVLGLSQEAMIASPGVTDRSTIRITRGPAMVRDELWTVRGIVARLREEPDVEIVPIVIVKCIPGAVISASDYADFKGEMLAGLRERGPFDGVVLAQHGAMEIEGLDCSGDSDLLPAVRATVGPGVPVSIALDLHGNITPAILAAVDCMSAFRTAPHRDDDRTGYKAADLLLRTMRGTIHPRTAAVHIPLFLPGELAMTTFAPAKQLYEALSDWDARPGVLNADIMVGFAWNDRPWIGMTALVTTDGDIDLARATAQELAAAIWAQRAEFVLRSESFDVAEGLLAAWRCPERPVYLSDSGDNVSAGAAGDLTTVLQAALDLPEIDDIVVANIVSAEVVRQAREAGIGSSFPLDLGELHISRPPQVRRVEALVEAVGDSLHPGGYQLFKGDNGAWARLRIGQVIATFHDRRLQVSTPQHLEAMGIDPTVHKIYVVKLGYLHPALEDLGGRHIVLMSDGTSNLDLTRLTYRQIRRPAYPFDRAMAWSPQEGLYDDGRG